ncbi:thioredoxin domain-containing protein [Microbacterium sp.]|uniref:DsbA family protein n=1 Tax=Microbacterium sp. TaxID=51671 RepID=UPI002899D227|nr:thioredoxin domain-containing protein [Microbacterium sp.]
MKTPVKATLIAIAAAVVLAIVGILYAMSQSTTVTAPPEGEKLQTVRTDSHVLDEGGPDAVTVVEFLDFECEACGAFYPIVEDLREQYAGDITYVVRYFPLPGHINSTQAALAAEAAAQQDRFEDMYHRLFETQAQWGERSEETPEVFRGFAEDLGLDMEAYDAAVADPATLARVQADKSDGETLGVSSTPSFFIDGEPVVLEAWGDLEAAIETAVSGAGS